jgi:hypothetical protein
MPRYLISFDHGAMNHIPAEEMPAVGEAAHAVVQEAMDAGVFVFAGGCEEATVVATDGSVSDAPPNKPYIGGLTIVDVPWPTVRTTCALTPSRSMPRDPSSRAASPSSSRSNPSRMWSVPR